MKKNSRTLLIFMLFGSCGVFIITASRAFFYASSETADEAPALPLPQKAASPVRTPSPADYPVRLVIPALGINAAVQHVGITPQGNMAAPTNYTDVGWFKYGPAPGEMGSAVIAGHLDNGLALATVFKRLKNLEIGDEFSVTAKDGRRMRFIVARKESYFYTDVPGDLLFGANGAPYTNLVTCDGNWLAKEKTYDRRLIVFGRLAE